MSNKPYKPPKSDEPMILNEPVATYPKRKTAKTSSSDKWNPNVPFHGTQEEWWEHFHQIEEGPFYPVSEAHQRIAQWLDNQEK
jgi:hypothetical protein